MIHLRYEDYKWKGDGIFDREKVALPTLLSPHLPDRILKKYGIPQLDIHGLEKKYSRKRKLEITENHTKTMQPNHKRTLSSTSSVGSPSGVASGSGRTTPATSVSSASSTPPTTSPSYAFRLNPVKEQNTDTTKINDYAENLKQKAIKLYQDRMFDISILDFTQSYLLFILGIRLKERELDLLTQKSDNERAKYISRKRRDWNDVLSFGEKIIDNFGKVISNVDPRIKSFEYMNQMLGFVHYTNGFIQLHLSKLFSQHIDILKNRNKTKDNYELTLQMIKLLDKYQEVSIRSEKSIQLGETKLGLFVIARSYPNLWSKSATKLSQIDRTNVILSENIRIGKEMTQLKEGINYCLPISMHLWNLDNILNFSGFFLKEWCTQQNIKHGLIFG